MESYTTIEIDLALHKVIEGARTSFSESPCAILHRLLDDKAERTVGGKAWSGGGVTLPDGTKVRMAYNGRQYDGEINDGCWLLDGERYSAPSAAAYAVARTKSGSPAHVNGWNYWEVQLPGQKSWRLIRELRPA